MPELRWLGDHDAKRAVRRVSYRLLEPIETIGDPQAGNWLIHGDNLEALKALLPFYAGRVKCIFIDPPYNTQSAFEHYDDNLEHSQWLSMIYPRMEMLRDLMAVNGSIWVTVDDNEGHYLKVVMDEIFGRRNFVANIVWQKVFAKKNKALVSGSHDNILVYARDIDRWNRNLLPRDNARLSAFRNPDNDPRGRWQSVAYTVQSEDSERRQAYRYDIALPSGRTVSPPQGRHWNGLPERTEQLRADNRLWFGSDGNGLPRMKVFLSEVQAGIVPDTWWSHKDAGTNQDSKKEMIELFPGVEPFGTPKPEKLVRRIVEIATSPGDIVLDSFLGSGTAAAVAHKLGRKWIGIEMGEHARTYCFPRLAKVVAGEMGGISALVKWAGGGGFNFLRLGDSAFGADGRISPNIRFSTLAAYLWFLESGGPHPTGTFDSPLLGVHKGSAIILLYNGILGDRRPEGGNVLTQAVWKAIVDVLPPHNGPRIIYGEACRLSPARLKSLAATFRQIPYDIRMR